MRTRNNGKEKRLTDVLEYGKLDLDLSYPVLGEAAAKVNESLCEFSNFTVDLGARDRIFPSAEPWSRKTSGILHRKGFTIG